MSGVLGLSWVGGIVEGKWGGRGLCWRCAAAPRRCVAIYRYKPAVVTGYGLGPCLMQRVGKDGGFGGFASSS